jgi:hypothetical protein
VNNGGGEEECRGREKAAGERFADISTLSGTLLAVKEALLRENWKSVEA